MVFDSCGRFDRLNPKQSSPAVSDFYNGNSAGNDTDNDSLWNNVIPDEPESRGSIADEDNTLGITNRGCLSKPNVTCDEMTLGSLISTDIESSKYNSEILTHTSAGNTNVHSVSLQMSPVVLFCEHIEEIEEDVMSFYSQDVSSLNSQGESSYDDSTTLSYRNTNGPISAYQFVPAAPLGIEKQLFGEDGPSFRLKNTTSPVSKTSPVKRISSVDKYWGGIVDATSSLLASGKRTKEKSFPANWEQNGFSVRKPKNLEAMVNKIKTKSKKASQKWFSFQQSSNSLITDVTSIVRSERTTTNREPNEYVVSGGQHQSETTTEEVQPKQSTWCYGNVQLVKERFILKPDYRGRLNLQSNMEEILRSIDSDDFRHFVVDISNGFEVLPPSRLK